MGGGVWGGAVGGVGGGGGGAVSFATGDLLKGLFGDITISVFEDYRGVLLLILPTATRRAHNSPRKAYLLVPKASKRIKPYTDTL